MTLQYIKPERIWLKPHPEFNEAWVQDRIAEDPTILGLGDLVLKDKERIQPKAGRLDLLLQDAESNRRYEVEIQLGQTDESHIIRTIEYWDIERKRYPQYDHTAVIVAEDITSRFLNVLGLFNGFIPLVAIQMSVFQVGDNIALVFTKVLDEMQLGLVDEDEEVREVTDRAYWLSRGTKRTVGLADELLTVVQALDPNLDFKYNKFYIGLAKNDQPNNFVIFRPQKKALQIEVHMPKSDIISSMLNDAELDVMEYSTRNGNYRIRLTQADIKNHQEVLEKILKEAYELSNG